MPARMIVCFFGRNILIKKNAQNANLQDRNMSQAQVLKFLKKSYVISQ
jgi:hypothetical protein